MSAPNGNSEYPHTQTEYNSLVYSPYTKPPGYLNTGYFTAQSLLYGAGSPPAVNPIYYYLSKNQAYTGPRYQPTRLNPKPLYYPIMLYGNNMAAAPPAYYRPQPVVNYAQTYQMVPSYQPLQPPPPPPPVITISYMQPPLQMPAQPSAGHYSPNPYGISSQLAPSQPYSYKSSAYQPNNGYTSPQNYSSPTHSNYSSATYGLPAPLTSQLTLPQYSSAIQPSIPSYGSVSSPTNGYRPYSSVRPQVSYNASKSLPGYSSLPTIASEYKSANNYSYTMNQYSAQSYTTPSSLITYNTYSRPSLTAYSPAFSYGSQSSVPSYGYQPSVPSYGPQPSVPSYGAPPPPPSPPSYAGKQSAPSNYQTSLQPVNLSYPSSSYTPGQNYNSESYVSPNTYSQSYSSSQSLPSYGHSLSQPYASGYSAIQSYSSAYNSPNDYYASSSDRETVVIADSCPICIEDVAEPDLIDSLCDFGHIAVVERGVKTETNDQNSATHFISQVIREKDIILETNSTFSYSIGADCQCPQLNQSPVVLLTRSTSWNVKDTNRSNETQHAFHLILSDQSLVLKDSDLHREDIQRMIRDKGCL